MKINRIRDFKNTYKGLYRVKNPQKYIGNPNSVVFRSLWERQTFRWIDDNSKIVKWSSEKIQVPYVCKTDGNLHTYSVDLLIQTQDGKTKLVEIKPKRETYPPKRKTRSPLLLQEMMLYVKNISKWAAAKKYAEKRGWSFEIWTEDHLTKLGIPLYTKKSLTKKKKI
jgi:hypothetical protein